ncbi:MULTISPECIES: branched-chain amino acid ABC transporter permease [Delftia]|jgi:branched-chain amino acid transport system permease protein|uniref:Branched-chain amino acid ABC transporter permease n=3 Tax=Pseudomonadati TaxID=3379134 RepID=A0AAJ2R2S8_DELAC|nr:MULTISPECIES: branched-chain amino acid ABC transporter permease [Delftia]PIF35185.1 amino acid/amide ABC transporter membrane protein 1 (HAAT family) [Burkholderiales bacterium 23]EZP51979.1 Branched-chain amino acid transport system permease [Delftia sp. RIT313]KZK30433.1 ABC transporter permease [Delftia sp. GW456-R20]MBD9584768.1 branched-chain amino acid ABC transporter permease [Delftia sp. DLF01]MBJ2141170.1 branched-chain amino acid ABC transporter permease [Delftia acidovorans]
MDVFLQQVLNGLTLGGIYGLVALGLTLVYGILHVPNFAHGGFYMIGAFVAFQAMVAWSWGYWAAMLTAAIAVAVLGIVSERLIFHPLRKASPLHPKIASIGLLLFLEAGAQALWGADFQRMPTPYTSIVEMGGITAPAQRLLIIGAAFALMVALHLFLTRTITGATIIAMAQNREGASMVGIDANRVSMLTFAISGVLAAVAATLYAPINLVYPAMGHLVITKAFVIIILGGMGSIPGAVLGGLIIGFAESFGAYYISTDYKDIIAFVLLVVILSLRPQGLFAKRSH